MNKFEKLIEYIINDEEDKAKALFHQIVVEKSRDIYESLVDEDQFPVQRGRGAESLSDEIAGHKDVVDGDEEGMHEADDEFGDDLGAEGEPEMGAELGMDDAALGGEEIEGGEMGDEMGDEMGEEGLEDRVMDLEDAIDELKAEFDQLMAGEEHEEEMEPGIHGDESDLDREEEVADEFGDEEQAAADSELGDEAEVDGDKKFGEASIYGESKDDKKADAKKKAEAKKDKKADKKDVKEAQKSPADLMREYVEKVGMDYGKSKMPNEGDEVGATSEKVAVNKKSVQITGKNDMGGTTANIVKGGAEQAPDGKPVPTPNNEYTKKRGDLPGAGKFENVPGANTKGYKDNRKIKGTEQGAPVGAKNTMGSNQNNKSPDQATGGKPGFKG